MAQPFYVMLGPVRQCQPQHLPTLGIRKWSCADHGVQEGVEQGFELLVRNGTDLGPLEQECEPEIVEGLVEVRAQVETKPYQ